MNILELCLGEGLGGLELYFRKCCRHLTASNKVVVVTKTNSRLSKISGEEDRYGFTISRKFKNAPFISVFKLLKLINTHEIDLLHLHHKDDLPLVAWTKLFSRRKFKVVHTRQMQLPGSKKDLYHRFIYGTLDLFIAISDMLKADAEKKLHLPNDKIRRLYYGVEKANLQKADYDFVDHKDYFNIGVFSRIEYQKGQHLVIEAGKELLKEKDNLDVYFIGDVMDFEYRASLTKDMSPELSDHFKFKGFHPDPLTVMPCFDVIILPSKNETFGLVVVEAMRAGVAVIGTNAGGVPEIIDHKETGLLFEWGNSAQLALQLKTTIEDTVFRKKMASEGEKKADKMFNIEDHFNELNTIFQNLYRN